MCRNFCVPEVNELDDNFVVSSDFDLSPLPSPSPSSSEEKRVTIMEYMNHKIVDPDTAIADLKANLEKNIAKYNK